MVAHGELVVPGGDGAVAFEPVDAAFHGVTQFVQGGVEGGWAAAFRALLPPVGDLVGLDRDGRRDAAAAQVVPVGFRRVRLVGEDPVRAGPRPAADPGAVPGSRPRPG